MLRTIGHGAAHYGAAPGGTSAYLDGVLASTVFDLDATVAASYPGTGNVWANLAANPADGQVQTAYNFDRGAGAAAPTFQGSAGSQSAYWTNDGGDYFRLSSGMNSSFLKNLHKSSGGTDFWVAIALNYQNLGTQGYSGTNAGLTANMGVRFSNPSADDFTCLFTNGTLSAIADTNSVVADGTNRLVIFSYETSTRNWRFWNNATTAVVSGTIGALTVTADATHVFELFATGNASQIAGSGARMYSYAMGNEYLDNTKAAAIFAHLEARHGRDYTP